MGNAWNVGQASTVIETCRAGTTSHTDKRYASTKKKKKVHIPPAATILTWNVTGSTTMPDELRQIAHQRKPGIIVLTETKLTDALEDLPEYTLLHSCVKGNDSGHCSTGSGGLAIAAHKSLTSQNSVELIDHTPAAKSHLKTLRNKPPGSDCLTIWGVYLPSNDLRKREMLYQLGPDPPAMPPEPRFNIPVPPEDLKEFKQACPSHSPANLQILKRRATQWLQTKNKMH
ncbi:TPA: hypothetical protein ACH3X1_002717 [Trebouxia sp. C0004]